MNRTIPPLPATIASLLPLAVATAVCAGETSPVLDVPPSCAYPFEVTQAPLTLAAPSTTLLDDYIYGFVPVLMQATCELATAVPDNTVPGKAPINQFAYNDHLATAETQTVVRSNVDTLYTPAWLDLRREPVILHVPDMGDRYYVIPMLDAYSNAFASVGSRTTGNGPGDYAIVGPHWRGPRPREVSGVIRAQTNTVWLLGRTLVRSQADLPSAVAVSRQLLLIPLSSYPQYLQTGSYTPPVGVPVAEPNPSFNSKPLLSSPGFSTAEFFDSLLPYALLNPPPVPQFRQAAALVLDGLADQNQMTSAVKAQALSQAVAAASRTATVENGWSVNFELGSYGSNYLLRDGAALTGFGANLPADSVYMNAVVDSLKNPLSGANAYVIHFPPALTPPAHGFWSITAYDQQGFLVANSINRYAVGNNTGLLSNADGSVDIFVQNTEPAGEQANWLPVPSGTFNLTLRIYWPDESVLKRTWVPPAVTVRAAPQS